MVRAWTKPPTALTRGIAQALAAASHEPARLARVVTLPFGPSGRTPTRCTTGTRTRAEASPRLQVDEFA